MQNRIRHYRIQLIAYDVIDTPPWNLPIIGPGPSSVGQFPHVYKRRPRKIHLLPISAKDIPTKSPLAS